MNEVLGVARSALGAVLVIDRERRIRYCNDAAARLLGLDSPFADGEHCYRLLRGGDAFGNAYCGAQCAIVQMVERGQAPRPFELETRAGPLRLDPLPIRDGDDVAVLYQLRPATRQPEPRLPDASEEHLRRLSLREREILGLLVEGTETDTIAARLGITRTTVRNHVQRILRKLEVHSRLEAVAWALRRGVGRRALG